MSGDENPKKLKDIPLFHKFCCYNEYPLYFGILHILTNINGYIIDMFVYININNKA